MKRSAVYGIGRGINGREAAMAATQNALDQLGASKPALALVLISQELAVVDVLHGLLALLGDTPIWGFSTHSPLSDEGDQPRAVIVALLAGNELKAQVHWFPHFAQDAGETLRQLTQALPLELTQEILFAADGAAGQLDLLCATLRDQAGGVVGCMASGKPSLGRTFQIGMNQSGPGALSIAALGGRFKLGVGLAHGWRPVGVFFHVTRSQDERLYALDGAPAVESYARCLGYTAQAWAQPPLSSMARLYPLGIETQPGADLLLRSPLHVEADGSLWLNAPVPEGSVAHLMIADPEACLEAARRAAHQALENLGGARPLLALALVDAAWAALFETRPTQVSEALKSVLQDIPLVGAYTLGQIQPPTIHNQNLALVLIGETQDY